MTETLKPLCFRCPQSGTELSSDFCADAHTLSMVRLFSVRVHCPVCDVMHEFKMDEALSPSGLDAGRSARPRRRKSDG